MSYGYGSNYMPSMPRICARCPANLAEVAHTMSKFNTDTICMDCKDKEIKHPRYKEAADAELRAVQNGNYNFSGIGKPADL